MAVEEKSPILKLEEGECVAKDQQVYKRRWYMLFLFSVIVFTQTMFSGMWGPMAQSVQIVFGWNTGTIALLSSWGAVSTLVCSFGAIWLINKKGLRVLTLVGCLTLFAGAGIRSITSSKPAVTYTVNVGQFVNGITGTIINCGTPVLSGTWFPEGQRTIATTIALTSISVGHLIAPSLISLLINQEPVVPNGQASVTKNTQHKNCTTCNDTTTGHLNINETNFVYEVQIIEAKIYVDNLRDKIMVFLYVQVGWCSLLFLAVIIYFPEKPPKPPSTSATIKRTGFDKAWLQLLRMSQFWLIGVGYCVSVAPFFIWRTLIVFVMMDLGFSQHDSNTIEWRTGVATVVTVLVIGKVSDLFNTKLRLVLMIMLAIASACLLCLVLFHLRLLPYNHITMYFVLYFVESSMSSAAPLFFELCAEACFPIGEGVTVGFMCIFSGLFRVLFMTMFWVPHASTILTNSVLLGGCCISLIALAFFRGPLKRLELDQPLE